MLKNTFRIIYLNKKFLTTTSTITLPPNLILPDLSVFDPPPPPILQKYEDLFPQKLSVTSTNVKNFVNPEIETNKVVDLNPKVFGVPIRQDIIHQIVRYQRAKIRQPQCTKRVGDIRGSTRKLYQQKGTGHARAGQSRAAHRRGGMKSHGPVLRDFSFDVNRKVRALGMMIALAAKFKEGNLLVVDKMEVPDHRTKNLASILEKHNLLSTLNLFVDVNTNKNFEIASKNLQVIKYLKHEDINVYEILKKEKLVITAPALEELQKRIIAQREYKGKRKAIENSFNEYERLCSVGAEIS
mmetsp:Transcript_8903/g.9414  ORF Transcript_8903/g.9414 Transcript_8903/m.9414 type:complete len:297 (-) Transcript_8903:96-986(-)